MRLIEGRVSRRPFARNAFIPAVDALEFDALETADGRPSRARRAWRAAWPKLAAVALVLGAWQAIVWTGWRPEYVLPGPLAVFEKLGSAAGDGSLGAAVTTTVQRAMAGYAMAVAIGGGIGIAVARSRLLRSAIGSLVTGLQTMPSIAWFPLSILLFGLSERAILFVVVLGAAPSIANGVISGIDHVPPILVRAGRSLGARGLALQRHVVVPAAVPGVVAGLKQGWAFAWRSLMAGELLVLFPGKSSIGGSLTFAREVVDPEGLIAMMIVVLAIGILVDGLLFGRMERAVRSRFGLVDQARS